MHDVQCADKTFLRSENCFNCHTVHMCINIMTMLLKFIRLLYLFRQLYPS